MDRNSHINFGILPNRPKLAYVLMITPAPSTHTNPKYFIPVNLSIPVNLRGLGVRAANFDSFQYEMSYYMRSHIKTVFHYEI